MKSFLIFWRTPALPLVPAIAIKQQTVLRIFSAISAGAGNKLASLVTVVTLMVF